MTKLFQGGCACGAIRYKCSAKPLAVFFCHCLDCQKNTGAPFSVDVIVPKIAVTIDGKPKGYGTAKDKVTRFFCSECGSPLLNEPHNHPDILALKMSSLDDSTWLEPQAHIWIIRKQPWVKINDTLPQYEHGM